MRPFSMLAVGLAVSACSGDGSSSDATGSGAGAASSTGGGTASGGNGAAGSTSSGGSGASRTDASAGSSAAGSSGSGGSGGGAPGRDGSADGATGAASVPAIFRLCGLTSTTGATCSGLDAYVACVRSHCDPKLADCFGTGWPSDDFAGGACSDYASCALAATDPCHTTCTPTASCENCIGGLVTCLNQSSCTVPLCNNGAPPDGGTGGSPDGGTNISGTCADLAACCAAMTNPSYKDSCNQTLADAKARGGDPDCAVVYSTYRRAGAC